jgi:hypothetical protein
MRCHHRLNKTCTCTPLCMHTHTCRATHPHHPNTPTRSRAHSLPHSPEGARGENGGAGREQTKAHEVRAQREWKGGNQMPRGQNQWKMTTDISLQKENRCFHTVTNCSTFSLHLLLRAITSFHAECLRQCCCNMLEQNCHIHAGSANPRNQVADNRNECKHTITGKKPAPNCPRNNKSDSNRTIDSKDLLQGAGGLERLSWLASCCSCCGCFSCCCSLCS